MSKKRSQADGAGAGAASEASPRIVFPPLRATLAPPVFQPEQREAWLAHYRTHGFACIGGLLSPGQQLEACSLFWRDWCAVSPDFNRDDPATWTSTTCPASWSKGLAKRFGLCQGDFLWFLRAQTRLREPFEHIYGTTDLLASLDGFAVPELRPEGLRPLASRRPGGG